MRAATSSRQALSTLFRRERLRGKPAETQVTVLAAWVIALAASTLTWQRAWAPPPRPSSTAKVAVSTPGGMPAVSEVASLPCPVIRPELIVQVYRSWSPSGSTAVARQSTVSPARTVGLSGWQLAVGGRFPPAGRGAAELAAIGRALVPGW